MGLDLPFVSFLDLLLVMLVCSSSSSSSSSLLSAGSGVCWASSLMLLFFSGVVVLVVVDSGGGSTWFKVWSSTLVFGGSDKPLVVMSEGCWGGVASFVDSVWFSDLAEGVGEDWGVSVASAVLSNSAVLGLC